MLRVHEATGLLSTANGHMEFGPPLFSSLIISPVMSSLAGGRSESDVSTRSRIRPRANNPCPQRYFLIPYFNLRLKNLLSHLSSKFHRVTKTKALGPWRNRSGDRFLYLVYDSVLYRPLVALVAQLGCADFTLWVSENYLIRNPHLFNQSVVEILVLACFGCAGLG